MYWAIIKDNILPALNENNITETTLVIGYLGKKIQDKIASIDLVFQFPF